MHAENMGLILSALIITLLCLICLKVGFGILKFLWKHGIEVILMLLFVTCSLLLILSVTSCRADGNLTQSSIVRQAKYSKTTVNQISVPCQNYLDCHTLRCRCINTTKRTLLDTLPTRVVIFRDFPDTLKKRYLRSKK